MVLPVHLRDADLNLLVQLVELMELFELEIYDGHLLFVDAHTLVDDGDLDEVIVLECHPEFDSPLARESECV